MRAVFKAIAKPILWCIIKVMSRLHIEVDELAHYADRQNLIIWKRFLVKTLRLYNKFNGNGKNREG